MRNHLCPCMPYVFFNFTLYVLGLTWQWTKYSEFGVRRFKYQELYTVRDMVNRIIQSNTHLLCTQHPYASCTIPTAYCNMKVKWSVRCQDFTSTNYTVCLSWQTNYISMQGYICNDDISEPRSTIGRNFLSHVYHYAGINIFVNRVVASMKMRMKMMMVVMMMMMIMIMMIIMMISRCKRCIIQLIPSRLSVLYRHQCIHTRVHFHVSLNKICRPIIGV